MEDLIDTIYEAAVVTELWPSVLDELAAVSGSIGGSLLALDRAGVLPPRWTASAVLHEPTLAFLDSGASLHRARLERGVAARHGGFRREIDFMSADELAIDPMRQFLCQVGLGWQCASASLSPGGSTVLFTVERREADGPHSDDAVAALDILRPHLLRASILAARLGLERSRSAVAALAALGLPAAVVAANGAAIATNDLLEASSTIIRAGAGGRLSLRTPAAQTLFNDALDRLALGSASPPRSIPVPAAPDAPAAVIHVLPLKGAALDIFAGGQSLVIVAALLETASPGEDVLGGLFDLTPAEARVARGLVEGDTISTLAATLGVSEATIRTQLRAIFSKTGVHRQPDLIRLLSGLSQGPGFPET